MRHALWAAVLGGALIFAVLTFGARLGFHSSLLRSRYLPSILAGMSFGAIWFGLGWRWRARELALAGLNVQPLSRRLRGLVMVRGRVISPNTVTDPVTGEPCAFYALRIERQMLSARYRDWDKVAHEIICQDDIILDDGQGRALVHDLPTMDLPPTHVSPVWRVPDIPEHSRAVVTQLMQRSVFGTGENGRTKLWIIRQNDELTVIGTAQAAPAGSEADLAIGLGSAGMAGCTTRNGRQLAGDYRVKARAGTYVGGTIVLCALAALLYTLKLVG